MNIYMYVTTSAKTDHSNVFGPMTLLGLIASPNSLYGWFSPPLASDSPPPPVPPPSHPPTPYNVPPVILQWF